MNDLQPLYTGIEILNSDKRLNFINSFSGLKNN